MCVVSLAGSSQSRAKEKKNTTAVTLQSKNIGTAVWQSAE